MGLLYGWNIFRYLADGTHLISTLLLLYMMFKKRSCAGISFKTHLLYLIVFICRYINSGFFWPPIYNIIFKIFYISSSLCIVISMRTCLKKTYNKRHDNFQIIFIVIICAIATYFSTSSMGLDDLMWTFSLWLESFAIIPQLFLLQRTQRVDVMTHKYIFFLGLYRLFYVINWAYKFIRDNKKTPRVVWITGIIQTLLYIDFIYYYIKAIIKGAEFELPR